MRLVVLPRFGLCSGSTHLSEKKAGNIAASGHYCHLVYLESRQQGAGSNGGGAHLSFSSEPEDPGSLLSGMEERRAQRESLLGMRLSYQYVIDPSFTSEISVFDSGLYPRIEEVIRQAKLMYELTLNCRRLS